MSFFTSKVTPAPQKKVKEKEEGRNDGNDTKAPVEIHVMSLHDFQMELGGHRFPKIKSHETYRKEEGAGLTALHYAARRGDMEIVELLLEHGAKLSIKNDLGRDVLS